MADETTTRHVPGPADDGRGPGAAGAAEDQPAAPAGTAESPPSAPASADELSAAAPPDPEAPGTGETSFADAEAPPAGQPKPPDAEAEAARYLELAKRTQADFENYRKRMARENAAAAERGAAKLAKELLPALDHLELALNAASGPTQETSSAGTREDVIKGFAMVRDELLAALGKSGIQPFWPVGERFDPNEHEAMAQQPSEEAESGTVLEVYQRGYRAGGAVLRPARVVVAQ